MANGERADTDAAHGKRRGRGRDLTAAAGGLAAGGISQREAVGDLIGGDEPDVDVDAGPSDPVGISETSLDVFDDLDPSAPMVRAEVDTPDSGLPSLTFAPEPASSEPALAETAAEAPGPEAIFPAIESSPSPDNEASTPSFDDDESNDDDLDPEDAIVP